MQGGVGPHVLVADPVDLPADASSKHHVLNHDGLPVRVDRAQVRVLKDPH